MCVLDFLYANFSESTVSTKALFSMPRILKLFWKRGINPCLDCGARSFILLYYWTNQTIDHILSSIFESIFSLLHPRVIKCPRKWHLIQINSFYFSALLIFDLHLIFFGTTIRFSPSSSANSSAFFLHLKDTLHLAIMPALQQYHGSL